MRHSGVMPGCSKAAPCKRSPSGRPEALHQKHAKQSDEHKTSHTGYRNHQNAPPCMQSVPALKTCRALHCLYTVLQWHAQTREGLAMSWKLRVRMS